MYPKDERGEYRITHKWLEAFDAEGGRGLYSYFQECELREYGDGTSRVHIGPAIYLSERPDAIFAHSVYCAASRELRGFAKKCS